MASTKINLPHR